MKTAFAAASLAAFLTAPLTASESFADPDEYAFDKSHTTIRATWDHFGMSQQSIQFTDYDGVLLLDFEEPENSTVDITFNLIDGFWVGESHDRFIAHLNSDEIFNTAEYSTGRFVARSFQTEDGETGVMNGELTLMDQTHPVSLNVTLNHLGPHPFSGTQTAGLSATGTVKRSDYGLDIFAPNVSDEVELTIETELKLVTDESE